MKKRKDKLFFKGMCFYVAFALFLSVSSPLAPVQASGVSLSPPDRMVSLSPHFSFPVLKGLRFNPENPLAVEFIIDTVDSREISKEEAETLIRYFLAALTIPQEDIWVNLSPYESDKVVTESLSQTELGKDLLSQDYTLKHLSASLTYPDGDIGRDCWEGTD